ncbi:MAG: flagellar basal body rod protein FlgB [Fimbriimonadaceae bacterium]|nr:flagellar basal body rod protein FlgB [Fimbriimonadaceae bacterium]
MRILDNLFGPHIDNLSDALHKASERHGLLAENLANVNTPGYKRKDMDFNIVLKGEQKKLLLADNDLHSRRFVNGAENASVRVDGSSVDLEKEVMSIAETELRYQALTDFTNRYFSGLRNVIREGK